MQNKTFHVKNIDLIQKMKVNSLTSLVHKLLLPVQYKCLVNGARIQYSEKGNDKNILDLNELTSTFHASNFGKFFWVGNIKG